MERVETSIIMKKSLETYTIIGIVEKVQVNSCIHEQWMYLGKQ